MSKRTGLPTRQALKVLAEIVGISTVWTSSALLSTAATSRYQELVKEWMCTF